LEEIKEIKNILKPETNKEKIRSNIMKVLNEAILHK